MEIQEKIWRTKRQLQTRVLHPSRWTNESKSGTSGSVTYRSPKKEQINVLPLKRKVRTLTRKEGDGSTILRENEDPGDVVKEVKEQNEEDAAHDTRQGRSCRVQRH